MIKKIKALVTIALLAGKATSAPPVGSMLGQHGINLIKFCDEYNTQTKEQSGLIIPAKIVIYVDRSYSFTLKSPPVSLLLLKFTNLKKGASQPNLKDLTKSISNEKIKEIAIMKLKDLNTNNIEKAMLIIKGTAKSMGIQII